MDNEFIIFKPRQQSFSTIPVRLSPASLTNKQLLNKIRINHQKLPSQFFSNPRSMPDLQIPLLKIPNNDLNKNHKLINTKDDDGRQDKNGNYLLRDYRSQQRKRRSRQRLYQQSDTFQEMQDLGMTFSRLPIKKIQSNSKKLKEFYQKVYFKRVSTQPCEIIKEDNYQSKRDQMICQNLKISNIKQNNKGISVRKNNHPISTLREIKKNYL